MFSPLRDRNYPQGYEEKEGEKINKEFFEESYQISRQQALLEGRTSLWGEESLVTVFNPKLSDLCAVCCAWFLLFSKTTFSLVHFLFNSSFFSALSDSHLPGQDPTIFGRSLRNSRGERKPSECGGGSAPRGETRTWNL